MKISELVRDIKNNSSNFINDQKWIEGKFSWQEGYGVFSYAHSQIENVYKYIAKQEIHHQKIPIKEEYIELLLKMDIEFDEKYLFDWVE